MNSNLIECKAAINQATETITGLSAIIEDVCNEVVNKHKLFMAARNEYLDEIASRKEAIKDGIEEYNTKLLDIENEIKALQPKLVMATALKNAAKIEAIQEDILDLETSRAAFEKGKALLASADVKGPARAYAEVQSAFTEEMEYSKNYRECRKIFREELESQIKILQTICDKLKLTEGWTNIDRSTLNDLPSADE